jgi:hypothetical protein
VDFRCFLQSQHRCQKVLNVRLIHNDRLKAA